MSLISQQVKVFIDDNLSPAARARALATAAKKGLAELQASGRVSQFYERFVDGRRGAIEESVRPGGAIIYEFQYLGPAVLFALGFLRRRSPVRSGRYRDAFMVSVDGRSMRWDQFNPQLVPNSAEVIIYNIEPYSRKIDVQIAHGRRLQISVPPGLFNDAATALHQQFGGAVVARRLYSISFPGQYVIRRGEKKGSRVQSPALVLSSPS
jgi:hypothetical protein